MSGQSPIFVTADEPLLVFRSVEDATAYLESQDVEDGIYRGYDSDGRDYGIVAGSGFGCLQARGERRRLRAGEFEFHVDRQETAAAQREGAEP